MHSTIFLVATLLASFVLLVAAGPSDSDYQIGTAMTDVTGPAAETGTNFLQILF